MGISSLEITTADGKAPARLAVPDSGTASASVIIYMDVFGLRPALDRMAERLAGEGYAVLVPDLFYRAGDYGPFDAKTAFSNPETKQELMGLISGTPHASTIADTGAFLDALEGEGHRGPVGTVGYCFGGGRAINAASHHSDRVVAAASFHGGHLVSDDENSPHRGVVSIKGRVYIGSAGVDGSFPPEHSAIMAEELRRAEVDHTIENYVGMKHGWAVSDHGVYDETGAERHWKRLTTLFAETLKT